MIKDKVGIENIKNIRSFMETSYAGVTRGYSSYVHGIEVVDYQMVEEE